MGTQTETAAPGQRPAERAQGRHPSQPLSVVAASGSYLVRVGLQEVLRGMDGVSVSAALGDSDALLAAVDETVDVVVTDLVLPPGGGCEGIRIARTLARDAPRVGVVVLSEHSGDPSALTLFSDDATGRAYLVKDRLRTGPELEQAVRAVAAGESWFDPSTASQLVHRNGHGSGAPLSDLSPRERQVLAAIAEGKSNGAIAAEFVLTKRAVEKHVGSIFLKLGLPSEELVSRRVSAVLLYLGRTHE